MPSNPITSQEDTITLTSQDVKGPLNLTETILSAQTSEPEWLRNGNAFVDIQRFEKNAVKYSIEQSGTVDTFNLKVHFLRCGDANRGAIRQHLKEVLSLKDDLVSFYHMFNAPLEPLSMSFQKLRGLRLMRGTDAYESLICSILSQNNSALLWNRTARLLMRHYGEKVEFSDGSVAFLFPSASVMARRTARELRSKTSMGYRAKPVVQVSRMVASGDLNVNELRAMTYDEAMRVMLELPGVGPKVADCFLLYGLGKLEAAPVDVWIHRIVSKLYFRGRKVSKLKTARFLRDRFGGWAGYAQLYLFDYARRMGIGATERKAYQAAASR